MKPIGYYLSVKNPTGSIGRLLELERLALTNQKMPKNMSLLDIGYFYTVKMIGRQYETRQINEVKAYELLAKYLTEITLMYDNIK